VRGVQKEGGGLVLEKIDRKHINGCRRISLPELRVRNTFFVLLALLLHRLAFDHAETWMTF
jgi:hypothetical protein